MSGGTRISGTRPHVFYNIGGGASVFDGGANVIRSVPTTIYWVTVALDKEGEFLMLFDTPGVVPANGAVPRFVFGALQKGDGGLWTFGADGTSTNQGLTMAVSSTLPTLTITAVPAEYGITFGLADHP